MSVYCQKLDGYARLRAWVTLNAPSARTTMPQQRETYSAPKMIVRVSLKPTKGQGWKKLSSQHMVEILTVMIPVHTGEGATAVRYRLIHATELDVHLQRDIEPIL